MKKIRLKNLKLEASEMLGRNQLKTILGGYGGSCAVFVRSNGGSGSGYWSGCAYSVDAAQFYYSGSWTFSGGWTTTGYCCASCSHC